MLRIDDSPGDGDAVSSACDLYTMSVRFYEVTGALEVTVFPLFSVLLPFWFFPLVIYTCVCVCVYACMCMYVCMYVCSCINL